MFNGLSGDPKIVVTQQPNRSKSMTHFDSRQLAPEGYVLWATCWCYTKQRCQ
jgi:hypothetical protein